MVSVIQKSRYLKKGVGFDPIGTLAKDTSVYRLRVLGHLGFSVEG